MTGNTITITQASTKDGVTGLINPDGSFHWSSAGEDYVGTATQTSAVAKYQYLFKNCRSFYDATFKLDKALPLTVAGGSSGPMSTASVGTSRTAR